MDKLPEPVAYIYHDADSVHGINYAVHSVFLTLPHGRNPQYRNETPLYGPDCMEALLKERERADEAQKNYQFMVDRAADEKLDGYRELASQVVANIERAERYESEAAALRREVEMLRLYGNKDCTAMADAAIKEAK